MRPIADEVVQFINQLVDSIDQLEILRILARDREEKWSNAALADELQIPEATLGPQLRILEQRGLLKLYPPPALASQYGVRTAEIEQELTRLLDLYNERPVTLIRILDER